MIRRAVLGSKPHKGFTLIELMVVLTIMAVIFAFAYPSYKQQVYKSRRAEAQGLLLDVMARQERHHSENHSYTLTAANLGLSANDDGDYLSKDGWYMLSLANCPEPDDELVDCVAATAAPQQDQVNDDQCLTFNLNSQGKKGVSGSAEINQCW